MRRRTRAAALVLRRHRTEEGEVACLNGVCAAAMSSAYWQRLSAICGGTLGNTRFADDVAFVVKAGQGSRVFDMSGNEYIDYLLGSGPMILGHAHPAVVTAVQDYVDRGSTYFTLNEPAIQLAEVICQAVPCAEKIRFCSTGSEATFRLACGPHLHKG